MKLTTIERITLLFVLVLCVVGVYFSRTDLAYYEGVYTREDGLIEWLTVIALLMGSFISFYRSAILKPFRNWKFQLSLVFFGFVFLFGAGEEISWGQRIFDYNVPAFFTEHNAQGETNLHNMVVAGTKINKLVFGLMLGIAVFIYLIILPILYNKVNSIRKLVNEFAIPLPRIIHIVSYLLLVALSELIMGGKKGEILEFGGCWIFLLMTFNPYNREVFSRKSFER